MTERLALSESVDYLISRRAVVEKMLPPELLVVREGILDRLNREQADLDMINDVLNGYGYTEAIIESTAGVYDGNDGTKGAAEHPEDSTWNPNIIPGED